MLLLYLLLILSSLEPIWRCRTASYVKIGVVSIFIVNNRVNVLFILDALIFLSVSWLRHELGLSLSTIHGRHISHSVHHG